MTYINLYNSLGNVAIRRLVKIGNFTYVIGYVKVLTDPIQYQPYLAKLNANGNLVWQKRYLFPQTVNGYGTWDYVHFVDIVEITATGELILLVSDKNNHLLVKLTGEGNIVWTRKYYDLSDIPLEDFTSIHTFSRFYKLNESTLVLMVEELKYKNQADEKHVIFYRINPDNGNVLQCRKIVTSGITMVITDSEVRNGELWLFGFYDTYGAVILRISENLTIVQSIGLAYDGIRRGTNLLRIYASSPVFNGAYALMGPYLHSDQQSGSSFTRFFIAELDQANTSILTARLVNKNYLTSSQTIRRNAQGLFFSVNDRLYRTNNLLTNTEWVKRISVQELNTFLNVHKSIDNSFDSYTMLGVGNAFSIASTDFDYETCMTELINESLELTDESFAIVNIPLTITDFTPLTYANPTFELLQLESHPTNALCSPQPPVPDLSKSTIAADPPIITADGTSTSLITVELKDAQGNTINPSIQQVEFDTDAGTLSNIIAISDNGIYTTNLTSSTTEEIATIGFKILNVGESPNKATVQFKELGSIIELSEITSLQSEYLYLQASGSDGLDSTKGRHLRWAFRGTLGEKHLPKGNYATSYVNFNKQQDFVKIYKAEYIKKTITIDLINDVPNVVDHSNYLWIYKPGGTYEFYIRFANKEKYDEVKLSMFPSFSPSPFIEGYGSELIEIENIKELLFAVTCNFTAHTTTNRTFQVETLTVNSNNLVENKIVSNRKTLSGSTQFSNQPLRLLLENGRAIRWRIFNAKIASLDFELYSDAIQQINEASGWEELGQFALTLQDATALNQLEPTQGDVHGLWQRFNEDALVNINNYHDKWNGTTATGDKNIKKVVEDYIALSNNVNNFAAVENVSLGNDLSDPEDYVSVSNLDMLNFAAYDYHIARMLGLGILDIDENQQVSETKYVYVAEYFTYADLEDGLGPREVQHLFMSLPTSETDFRLPVPIEIEQIIPGTFVEGENGQFSPLTDENGYSHNGISRYVSLYTKELKEDEIDSPFFENDEQIDSSSSTTPVYGGLRYRINSGNWQKPELAHDPDYYNIVPQGQTPFFETRFLLVPEPLKAFYVHKQNVSGTHRYKSYGINWFSRAKIANSEVNIITTLKQKNPLIPPTNTQALLIRQEKPLMLTSQHEQNRLKVIMGDKTLIRLTYDYHSFHELKSYPVPIDSPLTNTQLLNDSAIFPDNEEVFADEVDIFFRNQLPANIKGKALSVNNHSTNPVLSVITTGTYQVVSTNKTYVPYIAPGTEANYIGGIFISGEQKYIIHSVTQATEGPIFTVYKKEVSDSVFAGETIPVAPYGQLQAPILVDGGLFMAVENMQNTGSWGTPNPLGFKVKIGNNWEIKREVIEKTDSGNVQRILEKTRGIWGTAQVALEAQANQPGTYKITFDSLVLGLHPQYNGNGVSAEWYGGIVRIFTESAVTGNSYNKTRKVLPVIKIENAGTSNNLVLYIQDPSYDSSDQNYDYIQTGDEIEVNFYPGYKVYLYADNPFGINEQNILPNEGESVRYSIFGFRSRDINGGCDPISGNCLSKISVPCTMFAQELVEAKPPEKPKGSRYATRPDFFGRSSYTLTTEYKHKPYGILFYRSNDEALLNALYEKQTIRSIRESLEILGGNNEKDLTYRWENFLNFEELESIGDYNVYPPGEEGYKFPNPDKQAFFDWANHILAELGESPINGDPGTIPVGDPQIINFVKGAVYNAFVSLTEVPILYQYLNGADYQPVDKPQVIRDRDGYTLPPYDPKDSNATPNDFEMAPMMKITGEPDYETLFTDFKLDGTSNNLYFYGVKELSTQMNMSSFSPFIGPVKLVNTNAPEAPEIKRIIPVLENQVLGISPHIQLEINAFPKVQNVRKVSIYRAKSFLDAQSVQTMQLVKIIDLEDENLLDEPIWTVTDNFEDLTEISYGDGLFYRVTVSREVRYADSNENTVIEYAPSQASKIVASLMMEANAPQSPILEFTSTDPDSNLEIHSVTLKWSKTAYKAKYHIYKMNSQGNWVEIYQFQTNDDEIELPLTDTDLQSGTLRLTNEEGNTLYHHFKVIAENTAGMLSTEENILTIYPHIGIGEMIIGSTFIVW